MSNKERWQKLAGINPKSEQSKKANKSTLNEGFGNLGIASPGIMGNPFDQRRSSEEFENALEEDVVSLDQFRDEKKRASYKRKLLVTRDGQVTVQTDNWLFVDIEHEDQAEAIIKGDILEAERLGAKFYEVAPGVEVGSKALKEVDSLSEIISPEVAQDISAYFGSNDSVDGPYKNVSKHQPFDDDKHRKDYLKKIKAECVARDKKRKK